MIKTIAVNKQVSQAAAAYHALIIDRSGSMSGVIRQVCKDAAERIGLAKSGDRLRVMWYSTEGGKWGTAYDGVLTSPKEVEQAQKAAMSLASTVGLTCFSEVLTDWANSLQGWSGPKTLTLLTDGYPVVSNERKEDAAIFKALQTAVGHGVNAAALVGYNWYDRNRLVSWSQVLGGTVIHADNISLFGSVAGSMLTGDNPDMIKVSVTEEIEGLDGAIAFTLRDGYPVLLPISQNGDVVTPGDFYITHPDIGYARQDNGLIEAWYAAAILWNQAGRGDVASDVLAVTGDVSLFSRVSNALTTQEHSQAEAAIGEAIKDVSQRFADGKKDGLRVDPNAFSFFSLLDKLREIDASFVPLPDWKYQRIGAGSERDPGIVVEFEPDTRLAHASFDDVVFSGGRLNLSVRVKIPGRVAIPAEGQAFGLPESLPSFIWRNYAIMVDGKLNTTRLPVSLPGISIVEFDDLPVSLETVYMDSAGWTGYIDLTGLPVMNRNQSSRAWRLADVATLLLQEQRLKARQKYLGDLLAPHRQEKRVESYAAVFGAEAAAWLSEQGVTSNGFSPKSKAVKQGDSYPATVIEFGLKKFSALPKVADVKTAIAEGKVNTPTKAIMAEAIRAVDEEMSQFAKSVSPEIAVEWLDKRMAKIRRDLAKLRETMTGAKFGIVFANRWFTDMSGREENSLTISTTIDEQPITVTAEVSIKTEQIAI